MKIFCCSDTHGQAFPVPDEADLILHGGDFYDKGYRGSNSTKGMKEIEAVIASVRESGTRCLAVRGNHDCSDPLGFFEDNDVTGDVRQVGDALHVVGLGWHGDRFYELPDGKIMAGVCRQLVDKCLRVMKEGDQSIFLTHFPPSGALAMQPGWVFDSIKSVVDAIRPRVVIQGHLHSLEGKSWIMDDVVYVSPGASGAMIELLPDAVDVWKLEV